MRFRTVLSVALFSLLCSVVQAEEVLLTLIADGSVTVKPGSGATSVERGKATATAQVVGDEDISSCEVYGRRSSATGRAAVTAPEMTSARALSYRLDAAAAANGGHYRSGTCIANRRIGFTGHDTEASADAVATAVVRIHFEGGRPNVPYFVKISRSQNGGPQTDFLTGPDGKNIPLMTADSPYPVILSRPGQDYFLRTTLAAAVRNNGSCCNDQSAATSDMTISVERAPLLFGGRQTGYIAGGLETLSYKNVAVVLLEGLPHCTATLVAPKVLVTAAHCVNGHMTNERLARGKVTVAFGSVYSQPLFAPVAVERATYPNSGSLVFDPVTLRHDVALLYLASPIAATGIAPSTLHSGTPTWQQIKSDQTKLTFVGFGFNVIDNEKVGLGIKREASWAISAYDDYAVSFSAPNTNTCSGDSGGPGFLQINGALILAAITSGGDDACKFGFDTRIDSYIEWLKAGISQK